PVHVPGEGHPWLRHDARRRTDRRLRPAALPRHVQLVLRAGLAAGELVRLARTARDVLLRLLRPEPVGRRLRPSALDAEPQAWARHRRAVPDHGSGARGHARRDVAWLSAPRAREAAPR